MLSKVRTDPDRGGTEAIAHPDCHGCQHSLLAGKSLCPFGNLSYSVLSSYRAAHLPHTYSWNFNAFVASDPVFSVCSPR